jgi:hypothetical protein
MELEARPPAQGSDTFLQHQQQYGPKGSTPWSRSDRWPERLHEKRPLETSSKVPKELCLPVTFYEFLHVKYKCMRGLVTFTKETFFALHLYSYRRQVRNPDLAKSGL